jgi:hypothetical protein
MKAPVVVWTISTRDHFLVRYPARVQPEWISHAPKPFDATGWHPDVGFTTTMDGQW